MVRTLSRRCTGSTALILFVSVWFRVVRRLVGSRFLWFGELWGCWFPTLAICYVAKIRNLGCKPELKSFIVAKPLQSGFGALVGSLIWRRRYRIKVLFTSLSHPRNPAALTTEALIP